MSIFDDAELDGEDLVGTTAINADSVAEAIAQVVFQMVEALEQTGVVDQYENGEEMAVVTVAGYKTVIYKDNETNGELN